MADRMQPSPLPAEQQRALFQAAAEEFATNGIDAASLDHIIARAGIDAPAVQDRFSGKADLFSALVDRALAVLFHQIGPFDLNALTAATFWSAIEEYYHRAIVLVDHNDWLVRFGRLFYHLRDTPRLGAATTPLFDVTRHWTEALILRGQRLGVLRDDLPLELLTDIAMGVLEPLDRWSVAHWADLSEAQRQALPEQHIGLFRRLLEDRSAKETLPED